MEDEINEENMEEVVDIAEKVEEGEEVSPEELDKLNKWVDAVEEGGKILNQIIDGISNIRDITNNVVGQIKKLKGELEEDEEG